MALRLPLQIQPRPARTGDHRCPALYSREPQHIRDSSEQVLSCARASGIRDGTATVQSMRGPSTILVEANDPRPIDGLGRVLAGRRPVKARHEHDDAARRSATMTPAAKPNGDSPAMEPQVSETPAAMDAAVRTGRWQRISLIELDGPRSREAAVTSAGLAETRACARPPVASPSPQLEEESMCG